MPILSTIQKRTFAGRSLLASMYIVLVVGGISMVYPFLLLLSGSIKSDVDARQFDVFPKYLTDDTALFRKFEEKRYGSMGGGLPEFLASTLQPCYSEDRKPVF